MRQRVSRTFTRVSRWSALALFISKRDSQSNASQKSAISYPISPANTSMLPSSMSADDAASVIIPDRSFPYETKYDIVPPAEFEGNTSQVDLAFPRPNLVSEQSNAVLWRLEEDKDEQTVPTGTSQSVRMYHEPSRRLFRLQEALAKMTGGTTGTGVETTDLPGPSAKAGLSRSPPAQQRPVSINSMDTEVTEIVDNESSDDEAPSFKPKVAAYPSSRGILLGTSSEARLSPISGNIPIEFEGVKLNLRMDDDGKTSSGSEDMGRQSKELTTSGASANLDITLGNASGDTLGNLGILDSVNNSDENQTLQTRGVSSTSTTLGERRGRIPERLNFVTDADQSR